MAEETKAEAAAAVASPAAVGEAAVVVEEEKKVEEASAAVEEVEKEAEEEGARVEGSGLFKEESSKVSDLSDAEKKALEELKKLVSEALAKREFTAPPPAPAKEPEKAEETKLEEPKTEEEPKAEEPKTEEEPAKAEEVPKAAEKAPKAAEEEPKVVVETKPEEPKVVVETKAEEPKVVVETKPEEPKVVVETKPEEPKVVEAPKAEESKVVEAPKAEEPKAVEAPKTEATVVEEKTVEAIAETVVEVTAAEPAGELSSEPAPVPVPEPEEVDIWGVRLLDDEKSDVVLLKFLRARDFKVKDALSMLKNTCRWRKEFEIEALLGEDLGNELDCVVFTHGVDREGHPVCYNVYGEFQKKELYDKAFADAEKRQRFLRWRIQFLEKSIRNQLDFTPGGVCTIVQVNDLKSSPGPAKWELRQTTNQALQLLQDNYPEFVAKQVS